MANRDTTSTPYKTSADGVCYFAYPNGDAPIVAVADYTELRTKTSANGFNSSIYVSGTYHAGVFKYSSTNPRPAHGDDGGLVIAASGGGWWVRQFTYLAARPIELNWFESVVNNFDITALFKRLAADFTPNFFIRVPDKTIKLIWNSPGLFDWTTTSAISKFRIYESTAPVELYMAAAVKADVYAWKMEVDDFLLGSLVKKASPFDYLLTFSSSWTFDNRLYRDTDTAGWETPPPTIDVYMRAAYANYGYTRCNATKLQGYFIHVEGRDNLHFRASGVLHYGTGWACAGPGLFEFENLNLWDECIRRGGWTGTTEGFTSRNMALARCGQMNGASATQTGKAYLKGDITLKYNCGFEIFSWDHVGNSLNDPLVVRIKNNGVTGPNEFGKPVGVHMMAGTIHNNHMLKSDGFGPLTKDVVDKRFFKFIVEYDEYGEFTGIDQWVNFMFIENNSKDDIGPPYAMCYTQHIKYIIVGARGRLWEASGPDFGGGPQDIQEIDIMGDGVNAAWTSRSSSIVNLEKTHRVKYIKLHNMYAHREGIVLDTVNSTGRLQLAPGANVTATNLTFSGAARNIIHADDELGLGSPSIAITNLHAPVGSTITADAGMTATVTINGVSKTLPYTIQAGDIGTAVPDIPPNPLLGAA